MAIGLSTSRLFFTLLSAHSRCFILISFLNKPDDDDDDKRFHKLFITIYLKDGNKRSRRKSRIAFHANEIAFGLVVYTTIIINMMWFFMSHSVGCWEGLGHIMTVDFCRSVIAALFGGSLNRNPHMYEWKRLARSSEEMKRNKLSFSYCLFCLASLSLSLFQLHNSWLRLLFRKKRQNLLAFFPFGRTQIERSPRHCAIFSFGGASPIFLRDFNSISFPFQRPIELLISLAVGGGQ